MIPRYSRPEMSRIWSEQHRFETMLLIEVFACEAMAKRGKIPAKAVETIRARAKFDLSRIEELERITHHDVIAFVTNLAENVGPEGRYLHLGMTSSDVLDTATACQMLESCRLLERELKALRGALHDLAIRHRHTAMIGRTHGIHAQPITFGLKMALFFDETGRCLDRLQRAREQVCVGKISGAVGTYANLDPYIEEYVCRRLGIRPASTSSQIVSRDYHAQFLTTLALVGASLEKFAQEVRHLQRTEVREAEEPFAQGQKGSSAMPHKRNPILCERICGMARLLRANSLAALENVALWHERDISHSSVERVVLPDSCLALDYMLAKSTHLFENLVVYPEQMKKNLAASQGMWASEGILLELVRAGCSREDAYTWVQRNAMRVWQEGKDFQVLLRRDPEISRHLSAAQVKACFDWKRTLHNVDAIYQRLGLAAKPAPRKASKAAHG